MAAWDRTADHNYIGAAILRRAQLVKEDTEPSSRGGLDGMRGRQYRRWHVLLGCIPWTSGSQIACCLHRAMLGRRPHPRRLEERRPSGEFRGAPRALVHHHDVARSSRSSRAASCRPKHARAISHSSVSCLARSPSFFARPRGEASSSRDPAPELSVRTAASSSSRERCASAR